MITAQMQASFHFGNNLDYLKPMMLHPLAEMGSLKECCYSSARSSRRGAQGGMTLPAEVPPWCPPTVVGSLEPWRSCSLW